MSSNTMEAVSWDPYNPAFLRDPYPVFLNGAKPRRAAPPTPPPAALDGAPTEHTSLEGTWKLVVKGPTGPQPTLLVIARAGGTLSDSQTGQGSTTDVTDVRIDGRKVSWVNHVKSPTKLKVTFTGETTGSSMSGSCKPGFLGTYPFTAVKE